MKGGVVSTRLEIEPFVPNEQAIRKFYVGKLSACLRAA